MDIIILTKDVDYSIKLMNKISKLFKEYRIINILTNEKDFKDYIKANFFDVVIMEEYFIDKCSEVFTYNVHKICLLDNFAQNRKYICVHRDSERALYDNLAKIITKSSANNENVRELIRKELEFLNYNFSLRGTKYLEDAINLIYLKNCDCNLEKEVYTQLSKTYIKTAHTIKVNIQNSTNAMIDTYGYKNVLKYLGIDSNYGVGTKAIVCAILNKIKNANIERNT